jgi:hypothetical protein
VYTSRFLLAYNVLEFVKCKDPSQSFVGPSTLFHVQTKFGEARTVSPFERSSLTYLPPANSLSVASPSNFQILVSASYIFWSRSVHRLLRLFFRSDSVQPRPRLTAEVPDPRTSSRRTDNDFECFNTHIDNRHREWTGVV